MDPDGHRRTVRVLVSDGRGRRVGAAGLARWLTRIAPTRARGLVNIAIVSDGHVQRLNRQFRGVNKPTDVLSFPNSERRAASREVPRLLGDIVIAETKEWRVLALHGLLHLIGYDHERDDGRMRRVERRLRRKGGLREGLIDRVGRPFQGRRNVRLKGPRDQ